MGRWVGAVCAVAVVTGLTALASADHDRAGESSPIVPLRLEVRSRWPISVELLRREVEAIWSPHQIKIAWTTDERAVLVRIERSESVLPLAPGDEQWHVAVTRMLDGHIMPLMYVSLDAAARVARSASPPYSSPALAGIIVPRVAGRAIAHELAHFLLDTREHTEHGLLRARFSASDFVFPQRDAFGLDPAQVAAVRHRLEVRPLLPSTGHERDQ